MDLEVEGHSLSKVYHEIQAREVVHRSLVEELRNVWL